VARHRGHIAAKSGKFHAVIDLGRDEFTGKRRRKWSRGFVSEDDAQRELVRLLHGLDQGENVDPVKITVGMFLTDRWFPVISSELSPTSQKTYKAIMSGHILPYIGKIRLDRLDPTKLDRLYVTLRTEGGHRGGGLAPKTVKNAHGVLSAALTFAVKKGLISRNPALLAEAPGSGRSTIPSPWSAGELRAFLDHVEGDRLKALWWLVPFTGMRRSEALGLDWDDVDLDRGALAVTHTLVDADGGPVRRRETKTTSSRRRISLDPGTLGVLREHRRRQLEDRIAWGEGFTDSGLVFTREDGSALRPAWVSRRFDQLRKQTDLRWIRFHDLRHVWATLALEQGVPMKVVQERLGHSSISITMDVYSHLIEGLDRDAAGLVAGAVLGSSTQSSTQLPAKWRNQPR